MKNEMTLKEGIKKLLETIMTEKYLFWGSMVLMLLTTLGRLLDPLVIAHIVDTSVPNDDIGDIFVWGGAYAVVILLSGLTSYLQIIMMAKLGVKLITNLKYKIFSHLLFLPVGWFDKNPVGSLISRVESDCERVKDLFSHFSVTVISNILYFAGVLAVLLYRDWKVTLTLFVPMALVLVTAIFVIKYLTKYYKKSRELNADITSRLTEYIQGIHIVQLFNQQKKAEDYINEKSGEKRKVDSIASFIEFGAWGVNDFLIQTVLIILIVLTMAPKILVGDGVVTIGALIIFIQYSVRLVWPIIQISENLNQFQRAFVSLRRVYGLLDEDTENDTDGNEITSQATFQHDIVFENVWFKYKEDEWVLKDVSFTIKKGSKVALVGASGSGKTTTVSLLCRFYDIQKGRILVDGVDIYQLPLAQWRKKIGLILQDIILFPGNLLENIRIYDDNIAEEKVVESIIVSHATPLLQRLDNDILSEIKERGQNLSMGERQLISFARAICFEPEVVIMDEATASIDAKTEAMIQTSMERLLDGKTAVIVAHRLASVVDCDEILFFDNGEIIARGTHQQLLATSEEYQNLVQLQFMHNEVNKENK